MKELGGTIPSLSASGAGAGAGQEDAERERAFLQAWETMLAEGMDGTMEAPTADASKSSTSGTTKPADAGVEDAFQKTIRDAMDRMNQSEEALKVSTFSHQSIRSYEHWFSIVALI